MSRHRKILLVSLALAALGVGTPAAASAHAQSAMLKNSSCETSNGTCTFVCNPYSTVAVTGTASGSDAVSVTAACNTIQVASCSGLGSCTGDGTWDQALPGKGVCTITGGKGKCASGLAGSSIAAVHVTGRGIPAGPGTARA